MTTAEARTRFNIDEKELRKRIDTDMVIGIRKEGRKFVIPDDTLIIPSKMEIVAFLLQILKYKNNPSITISRGLCPSEDSLKAVLKYLYLRGFIGEYVYSKSLHSTFDTISLTDSGISYILGNAHSKKIEAVASVPVTVNLNFALVNC